MHQWIIYPENIGTHLAIDSSLISRRTVLLSPIKEAKKERFLVAIVAGTKTEQVIEHVSKIDKKDKPL
jgi:hypothetical protein